VALGSTKEEEVVVVVVVVVVVEYPYSCAMRAKMRASQPATLSDANNDDVVVLAKQRLKMFISLSLSLSPL
jgi:hypothetical protein